MAAETRDPVPIGSSDFRELREPGTGYVDKTHFVGDVLASPGKVLLFPRPRRFGKTVNLSTLRYFVERTEEDRRPLFSGLAISTREEAQKHYQRYPVLAMSFKDVKASTFDAALASMREEIRRAYDEHAYLLKGGSLRPDHAARFEQILYGEGDEALYRGALRELCGHLRRHHGEKVFILIDEYDTPIHAAFSAGYYEQAVEFLRGLLSGGLKDNPDLQKGVLTGVLRVAKESIFSGLNNLVIYSLLSHRFSTSFGFTEEEVEALCAGLGAADSLDDIRRWYNGYVFGGAVIYNPWSVMNYLTKREDGFRPYWVATGSNELISHLLFRQGLGLRGELEVLLSGGEVEKTIEESIVLRDLDRVPGALWSFLLYSGYLKATGIQDDDGNLRATLAIPNREVQGVFGKLVQSFIEEQTGGDVEPLLKALLEGDERSFERRLGQFLLTSMSYHDPSGKQPERVYHAFVLGLLVGLRPRYEVRSNGESGFGRYDVMVMPRQAGSPGVVLELKTLDAERGESVEDALCSALNQIREQRYAALLAERGASPIHEIAAVFDGKRVFVRKKTGERRERY